MKKDIAPTVGLVSAEAATGAPAPAATEETPDVFVMAEGLFYLTACADEDLDGPAVEAAIRRQCVAGTSNGWRLSDDPTFASGQPNPCACDQVPTRKHWLFAC